MATMKALRFHGAKDLRIDTIPIPEVKPGQVKVKPAWTGICGTDLHEYMMGPVLIPSTPHPVTGETIPLTLGHEFSGVVDEVGSNVTKFKPGDRVVLEPIIYDDDCSACNAGFLNCCDRGGFVGISGFGGGFAEYIVLEEKYLNSLPEGVSLEVGALVEPLSVAYRAVKSSGATPSSKILILGGGPIGLAVTLILRALSINKIVISEPSSARRNLAKHVGATQLLDPTSFSPEDFPSHVAKSLDGCDASNNGDLADIAFDCAGVPASLNAALSGTRAKATIINVAVWERPPPFPLNLLVFREKTYRGTAAAEHDDFEGVLKLMKDGKLDKALGLVTKKIKLQDAEKEGFMSLTAKGGTTEGKVLIEVGGGT